MSAHLSRQERRLQASPKAQAYLLAELKAARERLDERTAALNEICHWRDRLRHKIAYVAPDCDLSQFVAEVRAFKAAALPKSLVAANA